MTFPTTYQTDGSTSVWSFDFPYLDRSDVFVTVNGVVRSFSFVDDHTIKLVDLNGNPFATGLPLVINRVTPDLVSLAAFKDAANLTADDLNRARLQCLFLIQERSATAAGSSDGSGAWGDVGSVISGMTNQINTISGALNDLGTIQGTLQAGLGTIQGLSDRLTNAENSAATISDQINQEIQNRISDASVLTQQVSTLSLQVGQMNASVNSTVTLLQNSTNILAAQQSELQAQMDLLQQNGDSDEDYADLAASLITTAVTQVKNDKSNGDAISAVAETVSELKVELGDNIAGAVADLQASVTNEQQARIDGDNGLTGQVTALAQSITSLETSLSTTANGITQGYETLVQNEQDARITSINGLQSDLDGVNASLSTAIQATAQQITTVQAGLSTTNTNLSTGQTTQTQALAAVQQSMNAEVDSINGQITDLQAQYVLKAQVTRPDGQVVMGGIGIAATANNDYVGSTIALMADSVVFCDPNNVDGNLVPFLEAGLVDGGASLVIPSTIVGDQTIPGRVLVDGSIEAVSIAANTITGDKLVASTITADKLDINYGMNLLSNSEFVTPQGWNQFTSNTSIATGAAFSQDLPSEFPLGAHALSMHSTWVAPSTAQSNGYMALYSAPVSVVAGNYYEFSAYVASLRCLSSVQLTWLDSNGAAISSAGGSGVSACSVQPNEATGGTALSGYKRIGAIAVAPVNAAGAQLEIDKGPNAGSDTDSYCFICHPMVAETDATATRLKPYNPAGLGTVITPEGISTPSLSALSATIGTLQTTTSGARTVIQDNLITGYDSNNVMRFRLGTWT